MAEHKLTLRRGDCFDLSLIYTAGGMPVDLTGCRVELAVRWNYSARNPAGSVEIDGDVDLPTARVHFHLTAEQTLDVFAENASYQVRVVRADGCVNTLVAGALVVLPNIFVMS